MTIDVPAQQKLLIVGKYAFNGFSDEANSFCSPGCASDLAYLVAQDNSPYQKIVTFRSNVWRYELAGIIITAARASLVEGN